MQISQSLIVTIRILLSGTVTSEKGKFNFDKIPGGKYTLMVSFVGYETYEYEFEITEKNPNVKIKNIFLNLK